jgi:hypothetical protein
MPPLEARWTSERITVFITTIVPFPAGGSRR